jgi:hypothetical protein
MLASTRRHHDLVEARLAPQTFPALHVYPQSPIEFLTEFSVLYGGLTKFNHPQD